MSGSLEVIEMRIYTVLFALFAVLLIIGCVPSEPSIVRPDRVSEPAPVVEAPEPVEETVSTGDVSVVEEDLGLEDLEGLESDLDLVSW